MEIDISKLPEYREGAEASNDPAGYNTRGPDLHDETETGQTVAEETIMQLAEQNNFQVGRQDRNRAVKTARKYRAGRDQQFSAKATAETIDKIYKLANEMKVPLGELLRLAIDALERAGASR